MLVGCLWAIFALSLSSVEACEMNANCQVDLTNTDNQNLIAAIDTFTNTLIHNMFGKFPNTILVSPLSIYIALYMMLLGANGDTRTEIVTALGLTDFDLQVATSGLTEIINAVEVWRRQNADVKSTTTEQVLLSQAIFLQKDYTILDTFIQEIDELGGAAESVDFENNMDGAITTINNWISEETDGQMTEMVTSINSQTRLFLASSLYFSAGWETTFDPNQSFGSTFYSTNNKEIDVQMMTTTAYLPYYDNTELSYTAAQVPYRGNDFVLLIVLPYKQMDFANFIQSFTVAEYQNIIANSADQYVQVQLPKFSYVFGITLIDQFESLNINKLVTNADLSNMIESTVEQVALNEGIQNVEMTVNESGSLIDTVAVSSGAGGGSTNSVQSTLMSESTSPTAIMYVVDHPYLLFIRHVQSNIIVYAGAKYD